MPCQSNRNYTIDKTDGENLAEAFEIENRLVDITPIKVAFEKALPDNDNVLALANMNPRIRMTVLYAIGQKEGRLVAGTGNLSEITMGYFTKWGDGAFDLNVIGNLTTEEVIALGDALGLPEKFTRKTPSDGLSGKTDEEKIGFSYKILNEYIKTGVCQDEQIKAKIDAMHAAGRHKIIPPPVFEL